MMIAWALANWGKVIVGILVLSITIYIGVLKFQLGSARGEVAKLEGQLYKANSEIEDWKKLYSILGDKIAEQNKSIENLKHRTEQAKNARRTADQKAAPIVSRALEAENALQRVSASSGTCESELATIRELLEARK